jgi:hypothetical protein
VINSLVLVVLVAGCHGVKTPDSSASSTSPAGATSASTATSSAGVAAPVTVAGVVNLDPNIDATLADNLTPGAAVAGATVFLAGAPDQTAKTDADGAFTIDLDVAASGTSLSDPGDDTIVIWYTTPKLAHRFGIQQQFQPAAGGATQLGAVDLGITRTATFTPTDQASGKAVDPTSCTVTFPGYEGKIVVSVTGGKLTATYMPPGPYDISVMCASYQPLVESITITPAANFTDTQTVALSLTHL